MCDDNNHGPIKNEDQLKEIAKKILMWWKYEQFEEAYPGRNKYDEEPDFVKLAMQVLPDLKDELNI